ncbi:MAG: uroporphyrinogen-III C-methyltransferase [Betaproteobacteria bacterium]|nr:uroporphyrinogen-III C-methyltransferase [Betaproteobacteria bacterium]
MDENLSTPAPAVDTEKPAFAPAPAHPPAAASERQGGTFRRTPWVVAAIAALALAGWQWMENGALSDAQEQLARRLADSEGAGKASLAQAGEQLAAVQTRLAALEAKVEESRSQQATLEKLYQDIARNRDESAVAEIEQSVMLAAQQLQLVGNVPGAILALQAADARLAGGNRPQFIGLRRALVHDLDRLRALPQTDIAGISLRLESVVAAVDTLPLLADARPKADGKPAERGAPGAAAGKSFWQPAQRVAGEFWDEIRSLIRVQRFDRDEAPLLAPGQAFFLRENLKLRLLNARLALLSRDPATFRGELKQAQAWLERYFDVRGAATQNALGGLKQLAANEIGGEPPTLDESLAAVRGFKTGVVRK